VHPALESEPVAVFIPTLRLPIPETDVGQDVRDGPKLGRLAGTVVIQVGPQEEPVVHRLVAADRAARHAAVRLEGHPGQSLEAIRFTRDRMVPKQLSPARDAPIAVDVEPNAVLN
jgi:hypothetical protein